jgi:hypothetical protein
LNLATGTMSLIDFDMASLQAHPSTYHSRCCQWQPDVGNCTSDHEYFTHLKRFFYKDVIPRIESHLTCDEYNKVD